MGKENFEDLQLDVDIGSSEGLSVDQMTRSRLQFLLGQNGYIVRQVQIADAKAGTLLAIVGVLAIIITDRQAGVHPYIVATYFTITALVVSLCLITLLPRTPSKKLASEMRAVDVFSWPALSSGGLEAGQFASLMRTSDASLLVTSVARSNFANSRVLSVKFSLLRLALALALVDLLTFGAVLLL